MNKIPGFLFSFFILLLVGCTGGQAGEDIQTDQNDHPLFAFNDFPDSLFYGVYFGQPFEDSQQNLRQNGFELRDSSGSFYYTKFADSTEVIIAPIAKIKSLKIILKSDNYLKSKEDLLLLFKAKSYTFDSAAGFSVFDYKTKEFDFKLSVFSQENFMRLNFEQKASK